METLFTLLFLAAVIGVIYVAASRNPLRRCVKCKGTGVLRSGVLPGRYRVCPRCTRKGEVKAWGGKD